MWSSADVAVGNGIEHDEEDYNHEVFPSIYYENNWFSDHNGIGWQNGTNCCATDTIAFHYMRPRLMYGAYAYFYRGGKEYDPALDGIN